MPTFYACFADAVARHGDRVAVEWAGTETTTTTTYAALDAHAARVTGWLSASAHVGPGDRVAMLAHNDARWIATYFGILRAGAVVVPLDTAYSAAQVRTILADSGARVLFSSARLLPVAQAALAGAGDGAPRLVGPVEAPGVVGEATVDATAPATGVVDRADTDAAAILYTSGTTADPKGVVLTHGNLHAERDGVLEVVRADERDVVLGVLPLFHALAQMANLFVPLTIGARVVFLEQVSSTTLLDALQTRGITILACVPQFYYLIHQRVMATFAGHGTLVSRVLRAGMRGNAALRDRAGWNAGRRLFAPVHRALGPSMRLLITGGSRFDPAIARDLYGLGVSVYNGYGLTETTGAATIVRIGDRFTTSVGQSLRGVTVRIGAAEGADDGEVMIRGAIVMREYWRRPDATAASMQDGWLLTGDLGRLDADGRLFITGRKKDIIVLSSGKNIYPEEIEAHYGQSPFVRELCVVGRSRPGDPASERLHAVIVPDEAAMRERGVVNYRELIRFELESLSVALPAHKRVLTYDIWLDPLPRTSTGKLRRAEIERLIAQRQDAAGDERPLSADDEAWRAEPAHAALLRVVAQHLGAPDVRPNANLELDLGLDSMERVELITALEVHAARRVPAEARAKVFTARQLVDAVLAAESMAQPAAEAPAGTLAWDTVLAEPPDAALTAELRRAKTVRAFLIHGVLRAALGVGRLRLDLRVHGRDRLPHDGAFILCPNHQTYLDGFFVTGLLPYRAFRRIFFVGATEYFETRFAAWAARAINIVPVDPDANLVTAMQAAAAGLSLGKVLVLFPEGERSIDGTIKPFRKGAAILASHLGVPLVPVAVDGLFPIWPRGRGLSLRPLVRGRRHRVTIAFGEPIRVPRGEYAAGTDALQRAVATLAGGVRPDAPASPGRE